MRSRVEGRRVGTKRRDMRWETPDGQLWDSKFEFEVFRGLQGAGLPVRRTGPEDSLVYTHPVRNGRCLQCGAGELVTEHTYTPDLHVDLEAGAGLALDAQGYFVECKGYIRADGRSLLRSVRRSLPDVPLRMVVQRDYRVTRKLTVTEWARKFLKIPTAIFDGGPPKWVMP